MIVTLTANPSIDRAIEIDEPLEPGEVQAAQSAREDAGGKGINVARVLAAARLKVTAVVPIGVSDPFHTLLDQAAINTKRVSIRGRVRSNLTITDAQGTTTKLNLPGPELDANEREQLIKATVEASATADWLVLAGSLPPGAGDDFYVDVISAVRRAHNTRAPKIALDTSGAPLRETVERAHPELIKPNELELAELADTALAEGELDLSAVHETARTLVPKRVDTALITLGAQGALLVTADGAWHATPPPTQVLSTVGAGDSSLAGYLIAECAGEPAPQRLARAVRTGSAAAALPGTQAPTPTDLPNGDIAVAEIQ